MLIQKIESPNWSNPISDILSPHQESFKFQGVPINCPLNYEWWQVVDQSGIVLGLGWINFFENSYGELEGEVSLCKNVTMSKEFRGVGTFLLTCLENEITGRNIRNISAMVKRRNPEYDFVVQWFKRKGYEVIYLESSESETCLKKIS